MSLFSSDKDHHISADKKKAVETASFSLLSRLSQHSSKGRNAIAAADDCEDSVNAAIGILTTLVSGLKVNSTGPSEENQEPTNDDDEGDAVVDEEADDKGTDEENEAVVAPPTPELLPPPDEDDEKLKFHNDDAELISASFSFLTSLTFQ